MADRYANGKAYTPKKQRNLLVSQGLSWRLSTGVDAQQRLPPVSPHSSTPPADPAPPCDYPENAFKQGHFSIRS